MPPSRSLAKLFPTLIRSLILVFLATPVSIAYGECPNFHFANPVNLTSGPGPLNVVIGDFNEDGKPDLAVSNSDHQANGANASVAVFLATGSRSYAPPIYYAVGSQPYGITSGDFNEDGIIDLAIADIRSDYIGILLGQGTGGLGNGTFAAPVNYPAGDGPFHVVAADLNNDGITDLACSLNFLASQGMGVLLGQGSGGVGDGTFSSPVTYALNNRALGIEQGDWNDDGNVDLVVTEYYDGTFALFLGDGTGGYGIPSHIYGGAEPVDFATGDFNGDDKLDLAVSNASYGGTAVLLGDGAGGFDAPSFLVSGNTPNVTAFDVDQDGILDLVTGFATGGNGGNLKTYMGRGDGTFETPRTYSYGSDVYRVVAGDLDGDGHVDLVTANYLRNFVSVLYGSCELVPTPEPVLTRVRDVPNDQGGKVFLTWTASSLDVPGGSVNSYRVWRRIPEEELSTGGLPPSSATLTTRVATPEGAAIVYWEALATLPAQRLPGYGYTAATTQDSSRRGNPYSVFFITAATSNIDVFYSSNVDSGYSVDNLPPRRPVVVLNETTPSGYLIRWDANNEPDLEVYRIHRGASQDFVPSEANQLAAQTAVDFVDPSGTGTEYYKLSAVDKHGNESPFAVVMPTAPIAVGETDLDFGLRGVRPNPSRSGVLTVDLTLSRTGAARLEVIDLAGRRMAVRELQAVPGPQTVAFQGRERLPVGVYLIRLVQNAQAREIKAVVIE